MILRVMNISAENQSIKIESEHVFSKITEVNSLEEAIFESFDINGNTLLNYGNLSTENCFNITSPIYSEIKDVILNPYVKSLASV